MDIMESQITDGTSVQRRPGAIHFCNASVTWIPKRSCSADGEKCLQNSSHSDVKIAFTRQTPRCHAVWSLLQASRIALTFLQVLAHRLETGVVWRYDSFDLRNSKHWGNLEPHVARQMTYFSWHASFESHWKRRCLLFSWNFIGVFQT